MDNNDNDTEQFSQKIVTAALRVSFISLMFVIGFLVLRPFIMPVIWGIVFAIGIFPLHKKLTTLFGGRKKLSATLISSVGVLAIVLPVILFTSSTIDSVKKLVSDFHNGVLTIPKPAETITEWPIIGKPTFEIWSLAAKSISAVIIKFQDQIREFIPKITGILAGLGGSIFLFIIAIIIAGALLLYAEQGKAISNKVFKLLVGEKGSDFSDLSVLTIRSVVQGVIGIALLQTISISIGMYFIDLPAIGVLSIIILLFAIMQLPLALVTIPIIIYVFSYAGTTPAIIFTIWTIFWSMADGFLKPMFLGKGIDIPMLVVLLGSIGGMMLAGPVGLFVGSVILALAYKIFMALLED